MRWRRRGAWTLWLLTVFAMAGCGDPLVDRQAIVDTRVLAVQATVVDSDPRATPTPGEEVAARALVVSPDESDVFWRVEACLAEATTTGTPRCRSRIATASGESGVPALSWPTPQVDASTRMTLVGIACDAPIAESAEAWPAWSCSSGKRTLFSFDVAVQTDAFRNDNPVLARDRIELDGEAWGAGACDGGVEVASASTHTIAWAVSDNNREASDAGRETMLLSHFVTEGELERAFSAVPVRGEEAVASLTWTAPELGEGEDGVEVAFHFVARDQRGGVDWATYAVCVRR